jgi:hypothetical protein
VSGDPVARLRAARPPTRAWADTADGHDTWERTERRGLDAEFPAAPAGVSRARSVRWLPLTAGALALVGATAFTTIAVTGRSVPPDAVPRETGQSATGRMPAADSGALEAHRPFVAGGRAGLLQPRWLPAGLVLVRQFAAPDGSMWSRTWAAAGKSASAHGADGCLSDSVAITVVQGAGVEVPAVGVARLAVEPVVSGVPVMVVRTVDNGLSLAWTTLDLPRAGAVDVSISGSCSGDPVTSLGILLRVARSLH